MVKYHIRDIDMDTDTGARIRNLNLIHINDLRHRILHLRLLLESVLVLVRILVLVLVRRGHVLGRERPLPPILSRLFCLSLSPALGLVLSGLSELSDVRQRHLRQRAHRGLVKRR